MNLPYLIRNIWSEKAEPMTIGGHIWNLLTNTHYL